MSLSLSLLVSKKLKVKKKVNERFVPEPRESSVFRDFHAYFGYITLQHMDQRIRKLMTMHKALHPRDDIDRRYVSRNEGGRGLASVEDSVDTSIRRLEDYTKKNKERLITAIRNNTNNISTEQQPENKNKKKNNCMDISSDKQAKSHTGSLEMETSESLLIAATKQRYKGQIC